MGVNEEVKVVESSFDDLEAKLNEMSDQEWEWVDWNVSWENRRALLIFSRNLSVEALDSFDKIDRLIDKLAELKGDDNEDESF